MAIKRSSQSWPAGTVIPYEQLCLLVGHKSANSAATHVLRQYMAWLRDQLIATKAPYVITVAHEVGFGLCKLAEEPRRRELLCYQLVVRLAPKATVSR